MKEESEIHRQVAQRNMKGMENEAAVVSRVLRFETEAAEGRVGQHVEGTTRKATVGGNRCRGLAPKQLMPGPVPPAAASPPAEQEELTEFEARRNELMDTILADLEGSTRYKEMAKEEKNLRQLQKQVGQLGGIRGPTTREQEKLEFQKKLVVELELRIAEKWRQVDRLGQQAWEAGSRQVKS